MGSGMQSEMYKDNALRLNGFSVFSVSTCHVISFPSQAFLSLINILIYSWVTSRVSHG